MNLLNFLPSSYTPVITFRDTIGLTVLAVMVLALLGCLEFLRQ